MVIKISINTWKIANHTWLFCGYQKSESNIHTKSMEFPCRFFLVLWIFQNPMINHKKSCVENWVFFPVNGPQSPMSDDDMNYSCVKSVKTAKIIYNNNNNKPLFQIPRPLRQTIMVYCGINLQTSKTLRNTNQFLNGSKIGQSRSIADWLAFNFVDFLLFRNESSKCAVF